MTDWIGEQGFLKKFSCQYGAMDYPRHMKSISEPQDGETWYCKGKLTKNTSGRPTSWLIVKSGWKTARVKSPLPAAPP